MFNFITVCAQLLSHVQLFANPWTVDSQAPLSLEFSRQEYWNELPFPSPGDLPDPGITYVICLSIVDSQLLLSDTLYVEYIMRNAGLEEAQAGIKILGEISITSDMQMTPPSWQKVKKN